MCLFALGAPDVVPVVNTKVFVAVDALGVHVLEGHLLLLLELLVATKTYVARFSTRCGWIGGAKDLLNV